MILIIQSNIPFNAKACISIGLIMKYILVYQSEKIRIGKFYNNLIPIIKKSHSRQEQLFEFLSTQTKLLF